jgi:hypothetical protein
LSGKLAGTRRARQQFRFVYESDNFFEFQIFETFFRESNKESHSKGDLAWFNNLL